MRLIYDRIDIASIRRQDYPWVVEVKRLSEDLFSDAIQQRGSGPVAHTYEIYKDRAGEYRARFKYNSETIFVSEGYASKASARNAIESMKKNAPAAPVHDTTDSQNDLRMRIAQASVPAADRIVALDHSSEAYRSFSSLLDDLEKGVRTSNELATMNSDTLGVMKSEIAQLRTLVGQDQGRPAHIWSQAKSTLLYVADASASQLVGALAITALVALAALFGIDLNPLLQ